MIIFSIKRCLPFHHFVHPVKFPRILLSENVLTVSFTLRTLSLIGPVYMKKLWLYHFAFKKVCIFLSSNCPPCHNVLPQKRSPSVIFLQKKSLPCLIFRWRNSSSSAICTVDVLVNSPFHTLEYQINGGWGVFFRKNYPRTLTFY